MLLQTSAWPLSLKYSACHLTSEVAFYNIQIYIIVVDSSTLTSFVTYIDFDSLLPRRDCMDCMHNAVLSIGIFCSSVRRLKAAHCARWQYKTRKQMHRRWKAMQYRQKTSLYRSPYTIPQLSNFCNYCYKVRQKRRKIAAKIAKNTRFQMSPFALPPIGHCGEKFNIGAQLHLFRYKMSSKLCAKVQALR